MSVEINATNFPDEEFRRQVAFKFDSDRDGILSDTELVNAKKLELSQINLGGRQPDDAIRTLQGLEFLTSLESISLSSLRHITSIDVSALTNLKNLRITHCTSITSIDVSHNLQLKTLYLNCVPITTIDITQNVDLEEFTGGWNGVPSGMDPSECVSFTTIDVSHNTQLKVLSVNSITTGPPLQSIEFGNHVQAIEELLLPGAEITDLDLYILPNLKTINLYKTLMMDIDFSICPNLETIYCHNGSAAAINAYGLANLKFMDVSSNSQLQTLDVRECPELWYFDAGEGPQLTALDFAGCDGLRYIDLHNCSTLAGIQNLHNKAHLCKADLGSCYVLQSLDVSNCPNLEWLSVSAQQANFIFDASGDAKLHYLSIWEGANSSGLQSCIIVGCSRLIALIDAVEPTVASNHYRYQRTNSAYADDPEPLEEFAPNPAYMVTTLRVNPPAEYLQYGINTVLDQGELVITNQPHDQTIDEGEVAVFEVNVIGRQPIYQWEYRETANAYWTDLTGATSNVLEISWDGRETDAQYDGYQYRCRIESYGTIVYSQPATLTIIYEPVPLNVWIEPSASITEGTNVILHGLCSGSGLTYQWQVQNNGEWTDIRNANQPDYALVATMALNGKTYRCVVTNLGGHEKYLTDMTLTVTEDTSVAPPVISVHPVNVSVNEGSDASFTVAAEGDDLSYQWQVQKNGVWQSIQGATGTSYIVNATKAMDGAKYRCQVANVAGAVYSQSATLTVISQSYVTTPRVLTQPRSASVALGDLVSFIVRADGGELSYQWQKINNGQWYDVTGATGTIYTLTATSDLDGAQYRCVISNTAGSATTNVVTLTLRDTPILSFYGYHSLIISGKNTYGEWEMYPTSRPHVAPPEVKTSYVDLPGADGGLDYTDLLTGEPRYGYRKGSWEFLLIPQDRWASVYRDLVNFLHGKIHTVILEDDPNYVYTGRLSVNEWQSAAHNSLITIDYILEPFPREISGDDQSEADEEALNAAERLLNKEENAGMVIAKINGTAAIIDPETLFGNGDIIAY